jgi:hypothetical protein
LHGANRLQSRKAVIENKAERMPRFQLVQERALRFGAEQFRAAPH